MKCFTDNKCRDVSYYVGDWVYVKLCPYRQLSIARSYNKLSKRFYGLFQISESIGSIAYHFQLPVTSKIHMVFHCSLLKLYQGPLPSFLYSFLPTSSNDNPLVEPLAILATKSNNFINLPTKVVLVQWLGLAPQDTSWEK